jgi:hypothetical protein
MEFRVEGRAIAAPLHASCRSDRAALCSSITLRANLAASLNEPGAVASLDAGEEIGRPPGQVIEEWRRFWGSGAAGSGGVAGCKSVSGYRILHGDQRPPGPQPDHLLMIKGY